MKKDTSLGSVLSTCIGNAFEHYDTALFSFLSPYLAVWLFPSKDPLWSLIVVYGMIPLGMLARPLGALYFGYIGDVYGRKAALCGSLMGMAFASGAIALIPMGDHGLFMPILFCVGRLLQNFCSAGESAGGAIYLLENTSAEKKDWFSSFFSASSVAGILLASLAVTLLASHNLILKGWRYLYVLGCITGVFGLLLRGRNEKVSTQISSSQHLTMAEYLRVFWRHRRALLLIIVCSGFSYALYTISLVFLNGFIPLISNFSLDQMSHMNSFLLIADLVMLPLFGKLAKQITREKLMCIAALITVIAAPMLFLALPNASWLSLLGIRTLFVILGVAFSAPLYAWAQLLVSQKYRYSILAMGHAIGSQLLGGPTAFFSLWLFKITASATCAGGYLVALALLSSALLYRLHFTKDRTSVPIS
ncbi:MAG: MFS transporter [Chlamydiae bacterium]|nr:MFS transporter [Chlamydiota bacterium]